MSATSRFVTKISSGRFLLTQAAAGCMIMLTMTDCYIAIKHPEQKLPISIDGLVAIISMVFVSYFNAKPEIVEDQTQKPTP